MGSIPAAHLAALAPPDLFAGVVIESGIATGLAAPSQNLETEDKIAAVAPETPVLVIHGDADARRRRLSIPPSRTRPRQAIVPHENARKFVEKRPSARLLSLNAGHNDLLLDPANGRAYFQAIQLLVRAALTGAPMPEPPPAVGARARPAGPFGALA